MADLPVILHADYFATTGFGEGISHRAEQIAELLARVGPPVVRVEVDPSTIGKPAGLAWGLRHLWVSGYRVPHRLPLVGRYGRRLAALVRFFRRQPPGSCVVWCVASDWVIPHAARLADLPVVAVPMMNEAFVEFGHVVMGGGTVWDRLRFEVDRLSMARSVICSSREEQWLLAGFGLIADYLPMFPASALHNHLAGLRRRRVQNQLEHVLILSSFSNPPNRAGVLHLAKMIAALSRPRPAVILAGFETEQFRAHLPDGLFTIEGAVSQARLDELMIGARAMLIWQQSGTGALTRIPESLVAGMPVFCNGIAARSAHHYQGVHTFETVSELAELLDRDLPIPPIPPPYEAAERRFIDSVRQAIGLPSA